MAPGVDGAQKEGLTLTCVKRSETWKCNQGKTVQSSNLALHSSFQNLVLT